jgi:hypothetical protein
MSAAFELAPFLVPVVLFVVCFVILIWSTK